MMGLAGHSDVSDVNSISANTGNAFLRCPSRGERHGADREMWVAGGIHQRSVKTSNREPLHKNMMSEGRNGWSHAACPTPGRQTSTSRSPRSIDPCGPEHESRRVLNRGPKPPASVLKPASVCCDVRWGV